MSYNDLTGRVIGLGIATGVTGILAGLMLQFTRRIRNMPAYFKNNFSLFQGNPFFYRRKQKISNLSHHSLLSLFVNPYDPFISVGDIAGCQCGSQSMLARTVHWNFHHHTIPAIL